MPYDYSFFAGGANDNRGWKPRSLGPGNYNRSVDSSGTQTQLGDIRIFGSLEFRFPIKSIFDGCLFSDFGNIWTSKKDVNRPGAEFSKDFYKQLAWSLGAGIRIDLTILIFRLDFGFPIYNPSVPEKSRWIFDSRDAYYNKGVDYYGLNVGTNEENIAEAMKIMPKPFRPCINFGIGLPF
jgi:outer membrane protein assembly factor BamA